MKYPTIIAAAAAVASAHYDFPYLYVNGELSTGWQYVRETTQGYEPQYTPDILTSDDLRCNTGSFANAANTQVLSVNAGDAVVFGTDVSGTAKISHPGPMSYWLSLATSGDVKTYEGDGDWFKIGELGYNLPFVSGGSNWKSYNENKFSITIPADTPSGQYLLRIEHLAVHPPSTRQLFYNCAQIEVTGTGTAAPTDTVKIPGMYSASDAAMTWSMYSDPLPSSFPFPGPAVWGDNETSAAVAKREELLEMKFIA